MADEKIAFFTNASHQLRTPLTLVSGPLSQLMKDDNYTDEQKMLLQVVSRNVGQLETLTADVLRLARRNSLSMCFATVAIKCCCNKM